MGKCRSCGKQTLGDYDLCMQCKPPNSVGKRDIGGGSSNKNSGFAGSKTGGDIGNKRGNNPSQPYHQNQAGVGDINQNRHANSISSDYLKNGYFNEKGYLREEIFISDAMHVAAVLSARNMTSAALRRFYAKLRGISSRYTGSTDFEKIREKLYAFRPSVAYSVSRNVVTPEFQKFINININLAVKDVKHFKGFIEHFQSVVAYFKEKDSNRR